MMESVRKLDDILSAGNESYTGEDIRKSLSDAGYVIVHVLPPSETKQGCVCPPTSEQTCQGIMCPRKGFQMRVM